MNRERLIALGLGVSLGVSSALAITPSRVQAASKRPDIIAIMVDDLGYLPSDRVLKRLPNIGEQFLDGGVALRQMYGQTPLCGPARAIFLTGQNSLHNGVINNNGTIKNERKTVAAALRRVGYHTMMFGKYINNTKTPTPPRGWSRFKVTYSREKLADESASWIASAPTGKPLFAWFSSTSPHQCKQGSRPGWDCTSPWVPERYRGAAACADIAPFQPPTYRTWDPPRPFPYNMPDWPGGWKLTPICESMLSVDRLVREVVAAQQARGRPAYLVLFSDNGMSWGRKGNPAKHVPQSVQLPMYISGPGIAGGSASHKLLSLIDVAPTFAALGRASMPWADGRSFAPMLKGQRFDGRKRVLEHNFEPRANWRGIRTKQWHYVRWRNGKKQLYRVAGDPWEKVNLARRKKWRVRQLNKALNQLLRNAR